MPSSGWSGVAKARFNVGVQEKHIVDVSYSILTGRLKVAVDNLPVSSGLHRGLSKSIKFQVGKAEKHDVEIKASGLIDSSFEVYVDGSFMAKT